MPDRPTPPAGPGRFSQRDDKNQPVVTPRLEDPGINFGDIQQMREGQRVQPVPRGQAQQTSDSRFRPQAQGELPGFLFEMDSAFPAEPGSSGLPSGPGPGPEALETPAPIEDDREAVLFFLATQMQNEEALEELQRYREERAGRFEQQQAVSPQGPSLEAPVSEGPEPEEDEEGLGEDIFATEEELEGEEEEGDLAPPLAAPTPAAEAPLPQEVPPEAPPE